METNNNNTVKIVISVVMFLSAIGVYFVFDVPKMNIAKEKDAQIEQVGKNASSVSGYYQGVNNQIKSLEDAGWAEKKKKIEINFTSSPFFVSKTKFFLQKLALENGVTLNSVTYSAPVSVTAQPVVKEEQSSGTKISKSSSTTETVSQEPAVVTTYFSQIKGAVKKTTFNMSTTGTYESLKNFFKALEGQTRIGTVQSVTISSVKDKETTTKPIITKTKALPINALAVNIIVDFYSY
ncbi:MAG: hypothetical protein PHD31_02930 [Candidatus Pacebacteria bacterium]|nr:hypothetical protein [Candidatus Paceibacterota bacterium]